MKTIKEILSSKTVLLFIALTLGMILIDAIIYRLGA